MKKLLGLEESIKLFTDLCYTRAIYTLNAENYRVTDFEGQRMPDDRVLFTGYEIEKPMPLTENTPIRERLIKWLTGNEYVILNFYVSYKNYTTFTLKLSIIADLLT